MDVNIRKYIKENFKDSSIEDIKASIEESIQEEEEITLPGMGVFFEMIWKNSNQNEKEELLNKIKNSL